MRKLLFHLAILIATLAQAQDEQKQIRSIYDAALTKSEAYENLRVLCKDIGARLSGSEQAEKAVVWGEEALNKLGLDTVYLQEITVPHWYRGKKRESILF